MKSQEMIARKNIIPIWQESSQRLVSQNNIQPIGLTEKELLSQMKIQNLLIWIGTPNNFSTSRDAAPVYSRNQFEDETRKESTP